MLTTDNKFSDEISYADDVDVTPLPPTPVVDRARQAIPTIKTVPAPVVAPSANPLVSTEGAQRAKSDELVAKSLGFSPTPPVFEIGTRVNATGVDNFRRSREDWEKQPSLPELSRAFTAQIAAERREDKLVDAIELVALPDGRLGHRPDRDAWLVSERAMDGLATHITPGGASYLKQCPMDLRATNLNHWLSTSKQLDARASKKAGSEVYKNRQLTLRTRARKGGNREVFSVVGPRYAAFDVDRVAREAAEGIGGDARGTITYNGYRMTLDAVFHSNIRPEHAVAGEFFKGCVRIKAADDGSGSVNVSLGLWRNLCRNLIIVAFDKVLVGSRKHIGADTMQTDIAELMADASKRIDLIVGKWSEASTEQILERYDLQDVDDVFRGLVVNGAIKATGIKDDEMVGRLHRAWEREPGYSKTAILNAITRAAHTEEWRSWADTEELESAAGELLYQPVWSLDLGDRSAEELLA